jgi:hypothetical protein
MSPKQKNALATTGDAKAIAHLKQSVASGTHWYLALLEAVKYWKSAEEDYKERHYIYLIGGEAFDWLTLAERLCHEIGDSITETERINFLFFDQPPLEIPMEKFKRLIGPSKYRAYLNYLYGVLVEEALISAVVDEIRKERRSLGLNKHEDVTDKAYCRIYGATQKALLDKFRQEKKYPKRNSMSLTEHKEFTYWLFQHRLKVCDKSRVASDTRKALLKMHKDMATRKTPL